MEGIETIRADVAEGEDEGSEVKDVAIALLVLLEVLRTACTICGGGDAVATLPTITSVAIELKVEIMVDCSPEDVKTSVVTTEMSEM